MVYIPIVLAALLLLIAGLIYINPGPSVKQTEKTAWLKTIPIAHRGLHTDDAQVPENSMHAFERAIEKGYAIEIDLVFTADKKVVVFHDYTLKRMTGVNAKVSELTWPEIKDLKLLGSDQGIPLFKDFLAMVQGRVPLLIEVKNEGAVGPLEAGVIEDLQGYKGEYAVQSFNPFVVQYFKNHAPEMVRGQLSARFKGADLAPWKKFLLMSLLLNYVSCPQFVAYETGKLPRWMAKRLRKKGLLLLSWTVKSCDAYHRDKAIVDNIIFEGFEAPKA